MIEPRLLFIAGSARTGSLNKKLAQLGATIAEANGIVSTLADLGDYPMPLYNGDDEASGAVPDNARKLLALLAAHNGIFIASPEYNASISPLLKNAIDWVSRIRDGAGPGSSGAGLDVFQSRLFALGAAAAGGMGGIRGLVAVRNVLEMGLNALVLPDQMLVPRAASAFDEHGHLVDRDAQERYKTVIQKLARAARVLHG